MAGLLSSSSSENGMSTRNEIEEAIGLMEEMGIGRKQAVKALSRYNYDVARAADYIFSGNAEFDDGNSDGDGDESNDATADSTRRCLDGWFETEQLKSTDPITDETPGLSTGWLETEEDVRSTDSATRSGVSGSEEGISKSHLIKDHEKKTLSDAFANYDPAMWSVVPAETKSKQELPAATPSPLPPVRQSAQPSVTWWVDPSDPSDRVAKDNICIGLRPPPYDYAYVPAILQTLFHITFFQQAVFSFRPTADNWGSPHGYWRGEGEAVSGISLQHLSTNAPQSYSSTPCDASGVESCATNHDEFIESPSLNTVNEEHGSDNPATPMYMLLPDSVRALTELQKVFAFLRYSKRQYGSVCNFLRAARTLSPANKTWESADAVVDEFFDMLMKIFADVDEQHEPKLQQHSLQRLYNLFLLKAQDDYGDEIDEQELLYLSLRHDENARRFHDCLGPMVYDHRHVSNSMEPLLGDQEDKDDASQRTASSTDASNWRLTTFEKVPPILVVILDDHTDESKQPSKYLADKTIYVDRYMRENKHEALKCYQQAEQWREDIRKAEIEISNMSISNIPYRSERPPPTDKCDVLIKTMEYFEHKNVHNSKTDASTQSLQKLLGSVKQKITTRLEELHETKKKCQERLNNLFETPELHQRPYDIRALLHHDGGNGPGHYWAYIWVERANLRDDVPGEQGRWFRFCDAVVTPVSEDDVFSDPGSPFSVVYVDRSIASVTSHGLDNSVTETLKEFILKDNEDLERSIRVYNRGSLSDEDDAPAPANCKDVGSVTFEKDNLIESVDIPELPVTKADGNYLREYIEMLLMVSQTYSSDDYRILNKFENFLAKIRDFHALETFIYTYANGYTDDAPVLLETESRKDPELVPLWTEYDTYLKIARTIVDGLSAFVDANYHDSLSWLLQAKREEMSWKEHLLLETNLLDDQPMLQSLGFDHLILNYGKACIKVLDEAAYKKASSTAYCARGLHEATIIAHDAQVIIGPDLLAEDTLFCRMRERWLRFSETVGSALQESQADTLNALIMAFLEPEDHIGGDEAVIPLESSFLAQQSRDGQCPPLWREYKRLCQEANTSLSMLATTPYDN